MFGYATKTPCFNTIALGHYLAQMDEKYRLEHHVVSKAAELCEAGSGNEFDPATLENIQQSFENLVFCGINDVLVRAISDAIKSKNQSDVEKVGVLLVGRVCSDAFAAAEMSAREKATKAKCSHCFDAGCSRCEPAC